MNNAYITQLLNQELSGPPFNKIMSKDARRLREEVYELSFKNIKIKNADSLRDWIDKIKEVYDPLNFERAILFDYYDCVFEAVQRRTSKKYFDDSEEDKRNGNTRWPHEIGTRARNASRKSGLDWFWIAEFSDWKNIWYDIMGFNKANPSIDPKNFNSSIQYFRPVYDLFVDWMFTDFNRTSLIHIYNISNTYSIDFIEECMKYVENPRSRDPAYLLAIMQKEHAIMRAELDESNRDDEYAVQIAKKLSEHITHHESVDWDKFKSELQQKVQDQQELNKVKLS